MLIPVTLGHSFYVPVCSRTSWKEALTQLWGYVGWASLRRWSSSETLNQLWFILLVGCVLANSSRSLAKNINLAETISYWCIRSNQKEALHHVIRRHCPSTVTLSTGSVHLFTRHREPYIAMLTKTIRPCSISPDKENGLPIPIVWFASDQAKLEPVCQTIHFFGSNCF